jgi:hypothetical protein
MKRRSGLQRAGEDVIHLGLGNPGVDEPDRCAYPVALMALRRDRFRLFVARVFTR